MSDNEKLVFSVRPVTVYVLTRMHSAPGLASVEDIAQFRDRETAEQIAQALAIQAPGATVEKSGNASGRTSCLDGAAALSPDAAQWQTATGPLSR